MTVRLNELLRPSSSSPDVAERALALLRVSLGVVLMVGGWKLAFPADAAGLASSYTDPASGWIAPFFVEWITGVLSGDVAGFLRTLGFLEMSVGVALVAGLATPWVAGLAGLMFLSFAMAGPVAGMVRLAQDVSMAGFAFALAASGSGRWSLDRRLGWVPAFAPDRLSWFLGTIRVALLYSFVLALLFPFGAGVNPLNDTLPLLLVLLLAIGLLWPRTARISAGFIVVWMVTLVLLSVAQSVIEQGVPGLYWGLDATKRQLAFFGAAGAYYLIGPDRLSFLPPWGLAIEEVEPLDPPG